jgi:D-alanine-D-alanine ligase
MLSPLMSKLKIAVIFGGTNTEHEVSLVSARAIIDNLDKSKYEIIPIKITKENTWISPKELSSSYQPVIPNEIVPANKSLETITSVVESKQIDVVFPILHGPYGEDGTIQGMLELMRLPYVGCGVTASALCMDKVLQKNICEAYHIPVTPYFWFTRGEWDKKREETLSNLSAKLGDYYPLFVKPVNQGSSVGITKAHNKKELIAGIELALTRDIKIIVEKGVENVREIECAILGTNDNPEASVLGEISQEMNFMIIIPNILTTIVKQSFQQKCQKIYLMLFAKMQSQLLEYSTAMVSLA